MLDLSCTECGVDTSVQVAESRSVTGLDIGIAVNLGVLIAYCELQAGQLNTRTETEQVRKAVLQCDGTSNVVPVYKWSRGK